MIFSYSDFVTDDCSYSMKGNLKKEVKRTPRKLPKDYQLYFQNLGHCPSCKIKSKIVFNKYNIIWDTYGKNTLAYECQICGWWEVFYQWELDRDLIEEIDNEYDETFYLAILKNFDEASQGLPLDVLIKEFSRNKKAIYNIHPKKMEELVQHVFSQFYNCEVIHVGKTGDGGKDLIMINNDKPTLIQVKRRTKSEAIESVSTVRDLLGTMFIENVRKGVVVSTAKQFSIPSKKVANDLLQSNRLESFELIDLSRFSEMLGIMTQHQVPEWKRFLQKQGYPL